MGAAPACSRKQYSGANVINAIETFDESTGKITKVVQKVQRVNASV